MTAGAASLLVMLLSLLAVVAMCAEPAGDGHLSPEDEINLLAVLPWL